MNSTAKTSVTVTPVKEPKSIRSKLSEMSKKCENSNPNLTTPSAKLSGNSTSKSVKKSPKSVRKSPNFVNNKIRERRFVVAKKNSKREKSNSSCKCLIKCKSKICASVAYQTLRASQEGFFKSCTVDSDESKLRLEEEEEEIDSIDQNFNQCEENCGENKCLMNNGEDESGVKSEIGSGTLKRRRDRLLEEARQSVPESGRVMHLVKAFEKLLSIPKSKDSHKKNKEAEDTKKGIKWALPGLQSSKAPETEASTSSFCPSDFVLTSESLGLDSLVSSSLNSSQGSYAVSSRTLGGRRSRRNSLESTDRLGGRNCRRMQRKVTSQKPFRLRTEQRGRYKEEQFIKKVQEKLIEEEKQRIPIAQGLPWTTDEPERVAKPPVKESTRPVDLVLHSDVRAVERAEFDNQVAEKMSLIEQYRMEMERQQKLEEEEEIRRLRKELVPRAQPMPYFDRPFIPRRSEKPPTIPKEPKFHIPQHKKIKSCMSWNDTYSHLGVQL